MDNITVLNKIIEAEKQAQKIVSDAKKNERNLDETVSDEASALRRKYLTRENTRLEKVAEEERGFADEQIAKNRADFDKQIAEINELYKQNREKWIDLLFDKIVSLED